ncbi:MAG: methyltransferase domain-containing protein, partial [Burkholderiaceae bacterium]
MSELEDFYAAFQATFRGSRELITNRLGVYTPLLAELERWSSTPWRSIDYGCGRGEWIQLLTERGWDALGVDSNESILREATALGLHVEPAEMV